jgi:hypothetical protein
MRIMAHGWVTVLVACGGGGASKTTTSGGATTEPPQLVAARAKRDAICACKDESCVTGVTEGPLGREVEGPPLEDPAALRVLVGLGRETIECMYRVAGVPAVCLSMVRTATALTDCPAVTEEQLDSLNETLEVTRGQWTKIDWRAVSAATMREYEHTCDEMAAAMRDLVPECPPDRKQPGPASK